MADVEYRPVRMDWRSRRDRTLVVPGELLSVYQPVIGADAVLAWMNLAYALLEVGVILDPVRELELRQGLSRERALQALARLGEARLLEPSTDGGLVLREPIPRGRLVEHGRLYDRLVDEPLRSTVEASEAVQEAIAEVAAGMPGPPSGPAAPGSPRAAGAANGSALPPDPADTPGAPTPGTPGPLKDALQAVVDFYHKRIGLLGPVQYEKLRFWVEEKGVSPDVVAAAIEETATTAEHPRIQYLEGILRNWYNDGVRTMQDLIERNHWSKAFGKKPEAEPAGPGRDGSAPSPASRPGRGRGTAKEDPAPAETSEGLPNASAYRKVDREEIRRWKALHPEDYPT